MFQIHGDIVRDHDNQGPANHCDLSPVKTPACNGVTQEHAQKNGRDYSLDPDSATYLLVDELQRGDSEGIDAAEDCDEEDQASKTLKGEVQSADSLKEGVQSGESPNKIEFSPKGEVDSSHLHKAVSNGVCAIPTNDQNEPSEELIGNKSTVAVEVAPPAANTRTTRL